MPDYAIKLTNAYSKFQEYLNVAYAYCNLTQIFNASASLFSATSSVAYTRMFVRILTAMGDSWWRKTECIMDGWRGQNYYDIGLCSGKMLTVVLDTSLG